MISALNVLLCIFWLVMIPFILGSFLESGYVARCQITYNKMISRTFLFGFSFMLAAFQIAAVPCVYLGTSLSVLTNIWTTVIIVCATVSVCAYIYGRKIYARQSSLHNSTKFRRSYRLKYKFASFFRGSDKEALFIWAAAILMILFQTSLLISRQHTDTDDARYIAEALEAFEKNTLLRMHPITGEILDFPIGEMKKDVTSPYPVLIAVLSRLTMLHPAVLAHSVFPVLLIPLSYASMYVLGRYFFNDKRNSGVFMLVISIIVLFSFESIFAIGYTLLTIIWQGRSVFMAVFMPFILYLLVQIYTEGVRNNYIYVCLLIAFLAGADLSGTATALEICLGGTYALCDLIVNRKLKSAVKIGIALVPVMIYFCFYHYYIK